VIVVLIVLIAKSGHQTITKQVAPFIPAIRGFTLTDQYLQNV